jgi:hypothetical protein
MSGTSIAEIRDRLQAESRRHFPVAPLTASVGTSVSTEPVSELAVERAFVVTSPKTGHAFITGPAHVLPQDVQAKWEHASKANDNFLYIQGRFVEADRPNGNKALWTSEDLALGQPTVANGPLNLLHDETRIIGVINDSHLVHAAEGQQREAAAAAVLNTHIVAQAVVWKFLFPRETAAIQAASDRGQLWYSMECASRSVTCMTCGNETSHNEGVERNGSACGHVREGSAVRRFNEPTFLGGAVIMPPALPGWARADATVMKEAASVAERAGLTEDGALGRDEAEAMVAQIIQYANRAPVSV